MYTEIIFYQDYTIGSVIYKFLKTKCSVLFVAGKVCNGPPCMVMIKQELLLCRRRCELEGGRVLTGPAE